MAISYGLEPTVIGEGGLGKTVLVATSMIVTELSNSLHTYAAVTAGRRVSASGRTAAAPRQLAPDSDAVRFSPINRFRLA